MDKRRENRIQMRDVLFNKYIDGHPYAAELVDLSLHGMLVRTIREPNLTRDSYSVELGVKGTNERIWLWARKVWEFGNRQALRFEATNTADQIRLQNLLARAAA